MLENQFVSYKTRAREGVMSPLCVRRAFAPGISALVLLLVAGQAVGQTDTRWTNLDGGNWSVPANWDTGVPSGNFNAILDLLDGVDGYIVTMDSNFSIVGFTLDSPDATLDVTNNTLTLSGNSLVQTGTVMGTPGGTGTLRTGITQTATLRDTNLMHLAYQSRGSLVIDGSTLLDVCDTGIDHSGTSASWIGTGDIRMDSNSTWTVGSAGTFTISNDRTFFAPGAAPAFTLNGTLEKTGGTGISSFTNIAFANNGTIRVATNTLRVDEVTNFNAGVLTGGNWRVEGATSVLDLVAQSITTNRANVTLRGGVAAAQFQRLQGFLTLNDTAGMLTLEAGQTYSSVGNFTNMGTITVDGTEGASSFAIPLGFSLTNYTPGNKKLTGGKFIVIGQGRAAGSFEVPDFDVEIIDAEVSLSGVGANLVNTNNPDPNALRNLRLIDTDGKFTIRDGKGFLTTGDFAVAPTGELNIGQDSEFEVPATAEFLNFSQGTGEFNDGSFSVRGGRVIAPNIAIRFLNNAVTLDGPGNVGFFRREGMALVNGFDQLERIGSPGRTGHFTISGGYELDLRPAEGHNLELLQNSALTIGTPTSPGGRLRIPIDSEFPMNPGGNFLQAGHLSMFGGLLQIEGDWIQSPTATNTLVASQVVVGGNYLQNGLLNINGIVNVGGGFTVDGTLEGNATFNTGSGNFVLQNGILSPGMSAGTMNFGGMGDFLFARGRFAMEILGPNPGTGYDQINILHTLFFVGIDQKQLVVSLGNAYIPALGDTFDLVTFAEGRVGDFTDVQLPTIGYGRWFLRTDTPGAVRLVVVPAPTSALLLATLGVVALRRRR